MMLLLRRTALVLALLAMESGAMAQDATSQARQTQVGMGNALYAAMQREVELRARIAHLEEQLAEALKKSDAPK
jgi:hypothetical protein